MKHSAIKIIFHAKNVSNIVLVGRLSVAGSMRFQQVACLADIKQKLRFVTKSAYCTIWKKVIDNENDRVNETNSGTNGLCNCVTKEMEVE